MVLKFTPSIAKHLQNASLETHVDISNIQTPLNLITEVRRQEEGGAGIRSEVDQEDCQHCSW